MTSILGRAALIAAVTQTPAAPAPPPPTAVIVAYADGWQSSLRIGQTGCGSYNAQVSADGGLDAAAE